MLPPIVVISSTDDHTFNLRGLPISSVFPPLIVITTSDDSLMFPPIVVISTSNNIGALHLRAVSSEAIRFMSARIDGDGDSRLDDVLRARIAGTRVAHAVKAGGDLKLVLVMTVGMVEVASLL